MSETKETNQDQRSLEVEEFWRTEVRQRLAELRTGEVEGIPWDVAMAEMERCLKAG